MEKNAQILIVARQKYFVATTEGKDMDALAEERSSTIFSHLDLMNLTEFQDYFEEVLKSGDYALGLQFINAIVNKVELETRTKTLALQTLKLQNITGGMIKLSWGDKLD